MNRGVGKKRSWRITDFQRLLPGIPRMRGLGIRSRAIRVGNAIAKGYLLADVAAACRRYLSNAEPTSEPTQKAEPEGEKDDDDDRAWRGRRREGRLMPASPKRRYKFNNRGFPREIADSKFNTKFNNIQLVELCVEL